MISIRLSGDQELIARLGAMPDKLHKAIVAKVTVLTLRLESRIKDQKLSGQVLNVKTGALRRSIHSTFEDTPDKITGKVSSSGDVKYAAIHEFGGKINIPEMEAAKGHAFRFMTGGKEVFATRIRAHTVTMPERSYMRSSLREMQTEISEGLKEAVAEGTSK